LREHPLLFFLLLELTPYCQNTPITIRAQASLWIGWYWATAVRNDTCSLADLSSLIVRLFTTSSLSMLDTRRASTSLPQTELTPYCCRASTFTATTRTIAISYRHKVGWYWAIWKLWGTTLIDTTLRAIHGHTEAGTLLSQNCDNWFYKATSDDRQFNPESEQLVDLLIEPFYELELSPGFIAKLQCHATTRNLLFSSLVISSFRPTEALAQGLH
jgi:hypothetical protein